MEQARSHRPHFVCASVYMHHAHICVQAPAITQERLGMVEQAGNLGIPEVKVEKPQL